MMKDTALQYNADVTCSLKLPYSDPLSASTCTFLRFVLKGFSKDGRDLTDAETKAFLTAADKDGDGKIGIDGKRKVSKCFQFILQKDTKRRWE